jgi:hypothetical protein
MVQEPDALFREMLEEVIARLQGGRARARSVVPAPEGGTPGLGEGELVRPVYPGPGALAEHAAERERTRGGGAGGEGGKTGKRHGFNAWGGGGGAQHSTGQAQKSGPASAEPAPRGAGVASTAAGAGADKGGGQYSAGAARRGAALAEEGGGGVGAGLQEMEEHLNEMRQRIEVVDDMKTTLMGVSDRLNALTEYMLAEPVDKTAHQIQALSRKLDMLAEALVASQAAATAAADDDGDARPGTGGSGGAAGRARFAAGAPAPVQIPGWTG